MCGSCDEKGFTGRHIGGGQSGAAAAAACAVGIEAVVYEQAEKFAGSARRSSKAQAIKCIAGRHRGALRDTAFAPATSLNRDAERALWNDIRWAASEQRYGALISAPSGDLHAGPAAVVPSDRVHKGKSSFASRGWPGRARLATQRVAADSDRRRRRATPGARPCARAFARPRIFPKRARFTGRVAYGRLSGRAAARRRVGPAHQMVGRGSHT